MAFKLVMYSKTALSTDCFAKIYFVISALLACQNDGLPPAPSSVGTGCSSLQYQTRNLQLGRQRPATLQANLYEPLHPEYDTLQPVLLFSASAG